MDDARAGGFPEDVDLARALLPVLSERVAEATRRLEEAGELLVGSHSDSPQHVREADARVRGEMRAAEELGWLLGWIAGGLGTEVLLERHEPRALVLALELVGAALARTGSSLEAPETPEIGRGGGWCFAWAVAGLLWRAATEGESSIEVRWLRADGSRPASLQVNGRPSLGVCAHAADLERALSGTRFLAGTDGWSWSFPATWLAPGS